LHRLEKRGLLAIEWAGKQTGRKRRHYRLPARVQRLWRKQRDHGRTFAHAVNALPSL
jgi:DNA-binding PadR family transcriptional regulator